MLYRKTKGFTLLELIAVVFILLLILPMLATTAIKIRKQTITIACRMNLHQLSKGFFLYMVDNSGYLPHSDRDSDTGRNNCWFDVIDPYLATTNLNRVKQCPEWSGYGSLESTTDEHSLKMNGALCNQERPDSDQNKQTHYWPNIYYFERPSRTVLLVDGTMEPPLNTHTDTRIREPYLDVANRHEAVNVLFTNGASASIKAIPGGIIDWESNRGVIWNPYD